MGGISSQIKLSARKGLSFYLPVDEGPLCVHEVELVIQPGPSLHDCGRVGQAADRPERLEIIMREPCSLK